MANKDSFLSVERTARESFGLTIEDLRGRKRDSARKIPRTIVFYLAHRHAGKDVSEIAQRYNRDEVTVQQVLRNLENKIKRDSLELKRFVKRLPKNKLKYFQNYEATKHDAAEIPAIRVTALHAIPFRFRIVKQNTEKVRVVNTAKGVRWQVLNS